MHTWIKKVCLTKFWKVIFIIEASLAICHIFQVYLALVAHSVNISGAIRPGDTGHAATRLVVPATNVHYLPNLTLPTYTHTKVQKQTQI